MEGLALVFTEYAKRFIAVARQAFVGACVRAAEVSVAGLGLLTLLGLLSPHFWLADRAADLRVQVALLLGLLAMGLGLTRHLGIAAGATGLALVNLAVLWPLLAPGLPRVVPGWWPGFLLPTPTVAQAEPLVFVPATPLQVLSANVWFRNHHYAAMRAAVRAAAPDVAVFLEVTPRWQRELALLRDGWPYQRWVPGQGHDGVMVLSRLPWSAASAVALEGAGSYDALRVTVDLAGQPVDVLALHLRWPVTPGNAAAREVALARLAKLARQAPRPLVLVGDFNLTPHDGAFERLLTNGGLVNAAAASGLVTTWPASAGRWARHLPGLQIDHCLVTHGIRAESFVLGPWVGSDHRPVLVRLEVPVRLNAPAEGRSTSPP